MELFSKQGFEATSVQQITTLCGISKGAFYLYFESKDELISTIIDYFMTNFITDIDRTVRANESKDTLLYEFYYISFHFFGKHYNFANIFIKEQVLLLDEELITKMLDYDNRLNQVILYMLNQLYDQDKQDIFYDLVVCIKGFIRNYVELAFHLEMNVNLDSFAKSLVEKTNILAEHITLPFTTKEMLDRIYTPYSHKDVPTREHERDKIVLMIEEVVQDLEDPIEVESIEILKDHLLSETPRIVIVKGLLEIIKSNPQCHWIAYLIREYYEL